VGVRLLSLESNSETGVPPRQNQKSQSDKKEENEEECSWAGKEMQLFSGGKISPTYKECVIIELERTLLEGGYIFFRLGNRIRTNDERLFLRLRLKHEDSKLSGVLGGMGRFMGRSAPVTPLLSIFRWIGLSMNRGGGGSKLGGKKIIRRSS